MIKRQLTDFYYLQARLEVITPTELTKLVQEYQTLLAELPLSEQGEFELWAAFFQERAHILRRTTPNWPANRILLQLAMEHADNSPITIAAQEWLAKGNCTWHWLKQINRAKEVAKSPCLQVFEGHSDRVIGAKVLANGQILSWSQDKTARMWNADTGELVAILEGHRGASLETLSLGDSRLVTYSLPYYHTSEPDPFLHIWKQSGELEGAICADEKMVKGALILPNNQLLSWGEDATLCIWDLNSFERLIKVEHPNGGANGVLLLEDGRLLSWSRDNIMHVWDSNTWELTLFFKLHRHTDYLTKVMMLPNKRLLTLSTEDWDSSLCIWNLETGTLIAACCAGWVLGASILPDNRLITWEEYDKRNRLSIWSVETGELLFQLAGHNKRPGGAIALPGEGDRVVSWSEDSTLRIWDLASRKTLTLLEGHQGSVKGVTLLANSQLLSWSEDGTLRVWDSKEYKELITLAGHQSDIKDLLVLGKGKVLSWSADRALRLWDLGLGKLSQDLKGHYGPIMGTLMLPDKNVLSWSQNGSLCLWNSISGAQEIFFQGHEDEVRGALLLADGRLLSWADDAKLCIWHQQTGKLLLTLEDLQDRNKRGDIDSENWLKGALELPDNKILSWASNKNLRLWDSQTGHLITILQGHTQEIIGVELLSDNRIISWAEDHNLCLWDACSGKLLRSFPGVSNRQIIVLANNQLLCWSSDYTIKLWDLTTGSLINRFEGHSSDIRGAKLLPDGRLISWAGSEKLIYCWDLATGKLEKTFPLKNGCALDVVLLPDNKLLSWSCSTCGEWLHITDLETGECLKSISKEEAEQNYPDWQALHLIKDSTYGVVAQDGYYCTANASQSVLGLRKIASDISLAFWHSESQNATPAHLLADGTIVVGLGSCQLSYLECYQGNKQVDLHHLGNNITTCAS